MYKHVLQVSLTSFNATISSNNFVSVSCLCSSLRSSRDRSAVSLRAGSDAVQADVSFYTMRQTTIITITITITIITTTTIITNYCWGRSLHELFFLLGILHNGCNAKQYMKITI